MNVEYGIYRTPVELQLRYLLSLLSNHRILRNFHWYWRTRSQRLCCKCRHSNCAWIVSVFTCLTSLRPSGFRDCSTFSLHVFRLNSLRMIPWPTKCRKLMTKKVFLWSKRIPRIKRLAFVAAHHRAWTWITCWLTGNIRIFSTIVRFHFVTFSWIIHLLLHFLHLWSEPLYFSWLSSLYFTLFMNIPYLSISEKFFLHR